jgi:hypothetical protein
VQDVVVVVFGEALELDVVGGRRQQLVQIDANFGKVWPVLWVGVPAVVHVVVDLAARVFGLLQSVAIAHLLHHIGGTHARVGSGTERRDLPHENSKGLKFVEFLIEGFLRRIFEDIYPNIGFDGENVVVKGLNGHPSGSKGV